MRLKQLRQERGISQATIAKILKITQQAYANYERGVRQPDFETLIKIADYFCVSVDYILGHDSPLTTSNTGVVTNNQGAIGHIEMPVTVRNSIGPNKQLKDIIRIFNEADGKTQLKIMQFMYDIDEQNNQE